MDWFTELNATAGPSPEPKAKPEPQVTDWFSHVNDTGPSVPQNAPVEAKKETWGEWVRNSIKGRQDPKEAQTGTVYDQFTDQLRSPTATAAMGGANDEAMADIIKGNLGDKFIRQEKDANGYPIMVTKGPEGQEQRGYVNKPGLDTQDVWRGAYEAAPYAIGGGLVGQGLKAAGTGVKAVGQGLVAGLTSLAGSASNMIQGSEQGPDLPKAAVMTALGAAGPPLEMAAGSLWRKFVTVPGLFDEAAGTLTPKGIEAAKRAGIDPQDVTKDFAKSFAENLAKTKDEAQAATQAGIDRFGIPATRGQVTKDPYLLTQEEGMRRRLYGESAQDTMRGFDQRQAEAVRFAALGNDNAGGAGSGAFAPKLGIGEALNPQRQAGASSFDRAPATLGEGVQSGLKAAKQGAKKLEGEAWDKVKALEATPEALAELPAIINSKLAGRMPNQRATPAAFDMAQELQRILKGDAPEKAAEFLSSSPTRNVDEMRRGLLDLYKGAKDPADESLAKLMYDGFNDWIGEAAKKKLLAGDPESAMALASARGYSKEINSLFRPTLPDGSKSPAYARLKKIENADSGEGVVQALFGSQGSRSPSDGAVGTLKNLQAVLEKYAPDQAKAAWDDVRLAYWTRMVTGRNGELLGPQAVMNNIKAGMQGSKTIFDTLYVPTEQRQMREYVRALEAIVYRPPNASGSGYTTASFAKEWATKFLDAFGLGKVTDAAIQFSGVGKAMNAAAARAAVKQVARPIRPNITPAITSSGNALYDAAQE